VFGGNVFGWTADKRTSFELLDRFAEAGFETIDTADVYSSWVPGNSGGESETIIGEWMESRHCREKMIVVTKVGMEMGPLRKGLTAAYIGAAVEASLRRLKTDYVDVYLSHCHDATVPNEETLGAYQKLITAGKVRAIGASNHDATQLRAALDVSGTRSLPRYDVLEPEYNLYDRKGFETGLRQLALEEDLGVITYSSLASGFLSGKYHSTADLGRSKRAEMVRPYLNDRGFRILAALDEVSLRHRVESTEVALAWAMAQSGLTAAIASATSLLQLEALIRSASLKLTGEDLGQLADASSY
jgi:aryl-alcohol dehydrogenase-like predicted oxidoreductase